VEAAGAIGDAGGSGDSGDSGGFPRSPSTAWISDELLIDTVEVWSEAYGRPVSEPEAVEILMNVKRLAEVLFEAKQEMNES